MSIALLGSACAPALSAVLFSFAPAADATTGLCRYPDVSKTDIVFAYGNDLWIVPKQGGVASPLASPPGFEGTPRFSPDGKSIAFRANYDWPSTSTSFRSAAAFPSASLITPRLKACATGLPTATD